MGTNYYLVNKETKCKGIFVTLQEIFDKVSNHLLTQGKRCTVDGGCMYRGNDGTMCAVGCLIPDELYKPDIETVTVCLQSYQDSCRDALYSILRTCVPGFEPEKSNSAYQLLVDLQQIHDTAESPALEWPFKLRNLAVKWNLQANF